MANETPFLPDVGRALLARVRVLLASLPQDTDPRALAFFERLGRRLEAGRSEEDLADAFLELSTAAFVLAGIPLPRAARLRLDALLAHAQEVAETLSADPQQRH